MNQRSTQPTSQVSRNTRRAVLVAGGSAAMGVVAAASAEPAQAANGRAVLLGLTNTATVATTINATAAVGGAFTAHNTGTGAGAFFTSTRGNGFAGGSYSATGAGVNARNYATASGNGAGLVCQGGVNYGLVSSTSGQRFAGRFVNQAATATEFSSGGVLSDGGLGDGVVGLTTGDPSKFGGVTGVHYSGGFGLIGFEDNGGVGVYGGGASEGSAGVLANAAGDASLTTQPVALIAQVTAPATDAIQATGNVRITGDLFVNGTIHTNHPVDTAWTPPATPATRRVVRNAARAARKARASLPQ